MSPEAETPAASGAAAPEAAVEIVYFTDPLCCWSWAMEPQWLMLLRAFPGRIRWRYRMGAMISSWEAYDDPVNSIHRAGQMAPVWMEAARASGMPIDPGI